MTAKVMSVNSSELLASNAALSGDVQRTREQLKIALLTVEKLKVELAYLRRMKYGSSSEQLEHRQLQLDGTAPAQGAQQTQQPESNVASLEEARKKKRQANSKRAGLRELPDHLPRRTVVHTAERVNDFATPGVMNLLCRVEDCGRGVSPVVAG